MSQAIETGGFYRARRKRMKSTELLVRDSSARPRCWWYFASRPNEPPRKFLRLRRASDHHELNTK